MQVKEGNPQVTKGTYQPQGTRGRSALERSQYPQTLDQGRALVVAVQPLESWRELWIFHEARAEWAVDVLPPGTSDPDLGYVEFAGFAPGTHRLLIARWQDVAWRRDTLALH